MTRPVDLPPAERFPHGTRARYVCGCRCDACRRANADYSRVRAERAKQIAFENEPSRASPTGSCVGTPRRRCGRKLRVDSTGGRCEQCRLRLAADNLVDATPAREHLRKLSGLGVGYKAVSIASDVGRTSLQNIMSGRKMTLRKTALARILAVDVGAIADAGLVDATQTWTWINELIALGLSKTAIAKRLGVRGALQLRQGKVLARTEMNVRRIRDAIVNEHQEQARAVLESCHCTKPILLERDAGVVCAKCERAVISRAA